MAFEHHDDAARNAPVVRPAGSAGRRWKAAPGRSVLPGLALTAAGVTASLALGRLFPSVSPLMIALVLGAALANSGLSHPAFARGLKVAATTLLRAGIILLGLRLELGDVLGLGVPVLLVVLAAVVATFAGTVLVARSLGVGLGRAVLIGAGVAVCGASAVAAVSEAVGAEEDDVMVAIALVAVFGTLAALLFPLLQEPLALGNASFGMWVGVSVHEVGQVVAAAGTVGAAALAPATVVKLTRVVLLAPMVVGVNLWMRRGGRVDPGARRTPVVPLFVVGFLAAIGVSSLGIVPEPALGPIAFLQDALLCAGLFAMGTSVRLARLVWASGSSALAGAAGTLIVAGVGYAGILLIG